MTKNKSFSQTEATETIKTIAENTPFVELDEEVKYALHCASEKKALNIKVLDLREITSFTEFFIVASGTNRRQVQAISDEISDKLRRNLKIKANRIEGYQNAEWILLDYGDFVFHVFNETSRKFYDLERLWRDAKKVELPANL